MAPFHFSCHNQDDEARAIPVNKQVNNITISFNPEDSLPIDATAEQLQELEKANFRFAAMFYITTLQRSHTRTAVPAFIDILKANLNMNIENSEWFLSEFTNFELLRENLLDSTIEDMRRFITGLIYCAMLNLYNRDKGNLDQYWTLMNGQATEEEQRAYLLKNPLANFINSIITHFYETKNYVGHQAQYHQVLARFAQLGPEARLYLLKAKMIGRALDFFYDRQSPFNEKFRDLSTIQCVEKQVPDMGLPVPYEKKNMTYLEQILAKRREKALLEALPNYNFLIEMLGRLSQCINIRSNADGAPEEPSPYMADTHNWVVD